MMKRCIFFPVKCVRCDSSYWLVLPSPRAFYRPVPQSRDPWGRIILYYFITLYFCLWNILTELNIVRFHESTVKRSLGQNYIVLFYYFVFLSLKYTYSELNIGRFHSPEILEAELYCIILLLCIFVSKMYFLYWT